jgi:RimJ/RimL family protein N-acetyltransferase
MTPAFVLDPIAPDSDVSALAETLAPAFHGDPGPALEILAQTIDLLARDPRPSPWGSYLALEAGTAVGICAFKSAPDPKGVVEIAYMTFPACEGRGHATAMAAALSRIAFAAGSPLVIAHSLPQENASTRALRRNGFRFAGETIDPEDGPVWRWEKDEDGR